LLDEGMQLALLGTGDAELQDLFRTAAEAHPGQVSVLIGYDEELAHLIQAGSDAILVPSRFEPCGLTQLCALRYGAIPIVSRVGGLEDTVIDVGEDLRGPGTGFKFHPVAEKALANALIRANAYFQDRPNWRMMQISGMSTDVSWRSSARQYAGLFRELCHAKP
jgi:starch synthase